MDMQSVAAIAMGISLAACAGLRAFLPLLAVGIATRMEWWPVQPWLEWVGTNEALITFGVATILEILADKVPVLDTDSTLSIRSRGRLRERWWRWDRSTRCRRPWRWHLGSSWARRSRGAST